jgi:hypothetical protein
LAFFFTLKQGKMAAAAGFSFDNIQIGNVLSGINIGTHGMNSSDVAAMMVGVEAARANSEQSEEEDKTKDRERRLIIAVGSTVGIGLFVLILYLITLKLPK